MMRTFSFPLKVFPVAGCHTAILSFGRKRKDGGCRAKRLQEKTFKIPPTAQAIH